MSSNLPHLTMRMTQSGGTACGPIRALLGAVGAAALLLAAAPFTPLMALTGQAPATGQPTIFINRTAIVITEHVRLGDVAHIDAASQTEVERWQHLVLGRAPLPGRRRRFEGKLIAARLRNAGFPMATANLELPRQIEVLRAYAVVQSEDIERVVRGYLRRQLPWAPNQVTIGPVSAPTPIILPDGEVELKVVSSGLDNFLGPTTLTIIAEVDGTPAKRISAHVTIKVRAGVVRMMRPLQRGEIVSADMLRVEQRDLASMPNGVFHDLKEVIGMQARRPIQSLVLLRRDMLDRPPLVRRGDLVTLLAEMPGLSVRTRGKVMKNARRGEQVRILNLRSKREVIGTVLDAKTVSVEF